MLLHALTPSSDYFYCTLKPYNPLLPTTEPLLKQAWKLSGLLERDSTVYFGATEFMLLVRELIEDIGAENVPANTYPKALKFGITPCLTAVNAGTDDKAHIAELNHGTPGAHDFKAKAAKLQSKRNPS